MANLQQVPAKVCYTAAGILVHEGKVLLVKHKKLGIWLNPGGHIEESELPHQAAEREFKEETGVVVRAINPEPLPDSADSEYIPNPITSNLHWVSEENYQARVAGAEKSAHTKKHWKKGCEQHVGFLYLVEPVSGVEFKQDEEETDGIAWFTPQEVQALAATRDNIKLEIAKAFEIRGVMA